MKLIEITDRNAWDAYVTAHTNGHPLQLWGWGEAKRANGWTAHRLALSNGSEWLAVVQLLLWKIPLTKLYIAYAPRGPVGLPGGSDTQVLLRELIQWAKLRKTIMYVRIEPAWLQGEIGKGWGKTKHTIQMAKTFTIDLAKSTDDLLSAMSHKHRQYIRKSERDGIKIERITHSNLEQMYEIYTDTALRAKFGIHDLAYYESLHKELGGQSHLYYAQYENKPVAFLWIATAGTTAYELYGGVGKEGADLKANYYLKWRAMMDMKEQGYTVYDLNGRLNEGVSRFKEGFGPTETDYIGTFDSPIKKASYYAWEYLWPLIKPIGRRLMRLEHRIRNK